MFQERVAKFNMPEGFEIVVEPWPYGGLDPADERDRRFMQALIFATKKNANAPDANFYSYPMPIIPIVDSVTREVIRIHELTTGGDGEPLTFPPGQLAEHGLHHHQPSEYFPELLQGGTRTDLKELNVVQPDGVSYSVQNDSLVEWQKWRFRVSFNPREGAVLHDVHFDGRSVLYRLAFSDMTVPYADPRPPFHRKQAFDFGDGTLGDACNNLQLGCDCLGVIKVSVLVPHVNCSLQLTTPSLDSILMACSLAPTARPKNPLTSSAYTSKITASAGSTQTGALDEW